MPTTTAKKFKVQMNCLGSWEDTEWGEFDSEEEANEEIADLIDSASAAIAAGFMDEGYDREDYRVVPV